MIQKCEFKNGCIVERLVGANSELDLGIELLRATTSDLPQFSDTINTQVLNLQQIEGQISEVVDKLPKCRFCVYT